MNDLTDNTLRSAVAGGGKITFGTPGTVTLTNVIRIDRDTTILAENNSVVLDGAGTSRIFEVQKGVSVTLVGLHFKNALDSGYVNGKYGSAGGSAIRHLGGNLTLLNCAFSGNQSIASPDWNSAQGNISIGGAVRMLSGQLSVSNCVFSGNNVRAGDGGSEGCHIYGGALAAEYTQVQIESSRFIFNQGISGRGFSQDGIAQGGAIYLGQSPASFVNCFFGTNTCHGVGARGGAVRSDSRLQLQDCAFIENISLGKPTSASANAPLRFGNTGGGAVAAESACFVNSSTFTRNKTIGGGIGIGPVGCLTSGPWNGEGGAVAGSGGCVITNSIFVSNTALGNVGTNYCGDRIEARGMGGAVSFNSGVSVHFSTFATNRIGIASGESVPYSEGDSIASLLCSVNSSIFIDNPHHPFSGPIQDAGYNFSTDSWTGFTQPTSKSGVALEFLPASDLFIPAPGNPAIDGGDPSFFPVGDLLGNQRPFGSRADAGAFEYRSILRLSAPVVARDGSLRVNAENLSGRKYAIFQSFNLVTWTEIYRIENGNIISTNIYVPKPAAATYLAGRLLSAFE